LPKLTVHVVDESQQPLSGVQVALHRDRNSQAQQVRLTDGDGRTAFSGLPAGNYVFVLAYSGYATRRNFNYWYNGQDQTWEPWLKPTEGPSSFSPRDYDAIEKMNEYPD
jgi:hypothetical protein